MKMLGVDLDRRAEPIPKGYIQLAHGGILLLDEVGKGSPTGQARLLGAEG